MGSNGNEWEFIRLHRQHPQRLRCRSRADNLRALAIAMAQHAAAGAAARVLETACGTGIVTRALRDALPATAHLKATDLNREMMDVAREKVRAGEAVDFQVADGTALPFADASFGTMICQYDVLPGQGQRLSRGISRSHVRWPVLVQRLGLTQAQSIWQEHSRDHRKLFLRRSAPILRGTIQLLRPEPDQGSSARRWL
jgi:SAM-dependent methyltransferase